MLVLLNFISCHEIFFPWTQTERGREYRTWKGEINRKRQNIQQSVTKKGFLSKDSFYSLPTLMTTAIFYVLCCPSCWECHWNVSTKHMNAFHFPVSFRFLYLLLSLESNAMSSLLLSYRLLPFRCLSFNDIIVVNSSPRFDLYLLSASPQMTLLLDKINCAVDSLLFVILFDSCPALF
jgi:hypothetical protein